MLTFPNNRRDKIRVDFQTRIVVKMSGANIHTEGDSKNLSMKGIFVESSVNVEVDAKCHVQVFLSGTSEPVSLTMTGTVIRKDTDGFAIAFDAMDLDSYTQLRNIVRYNTAEPDAIH